MWKNAYTETDTWKTEERERDGRRGEGRKYKQKGNLYRQMPTKNVKGLIKLENPPMK